MTKISPTVTLHNGVAMPMLGLGVYQTSPGKETRDAVAHALELGYRHIDTARFYANENDVGEAIRSSGIPRDQVFITTKLANPDHGYDTAIAACEESLRLLGVDYLDLYLIHWPVKEKRGDSWRALAKLLADGKCRAIGVSNYTVRHLEELLKGTDVVPAVNQCEFSPFLYQKALHTFCESNKIQLEAYSPLTQGRRLAHPKIVDLAKKYGRTSAQLMLRWAIEHRIVVIPKSVRRERIEENGKIFDFTISAEDMTTLDGLDEGLRTCWNPTNVP